MFFPITRRPGQCRRVRWRHYARKPPGDIILSVFPDAGARSAVSKYNSDGIVPCDVLSRLYDALLILSAPVRAHQM